MDEKHDEKNESICVGEKLAPFNPTSDAAIDIALEFLSLSIEDNLYDLGCGDGRLLIRACEAFRCRGVGIEYDSRFYERAIQSVEEHQLTDQVLVTI